MPITKPAPMEPRISRDTASCVNVSPKAKKKAGTDMVIINSENTMRGPYLSIRAPTMIRAGMVRATLQMARTAMCSLVSQSMLASMVVASGAMLNQT